MIQSSFGSNEHSNATFWQKSLFPRLSKSWVACTSGDEDHMGTLLTSHTPIHQYNICNSPCAKMFIICDNMLQGFAFKFDFWEVFDNAFELIRNNSNFEIRFFNGFVGPNSLCSCMAETIIYVHSSCTAPNFKICFKVLCWTCRIRYAYPWFERKRGKM